MGILDGKRILVTGVLMESSIAFHTAKLAHDFRSALPGISRFIVFAFPNVRPTSFNSRKECSHLPFAFGGRPITLSRHTSRCCDGLLSVC